MATSEVKLSPPCWATVLDFMIVRAMDVETVTGHR